MTGLEKITGEIKAVSDRLVSEIIDKAKSEADEIIEGAKKEANETKEKISRELSVRLANSKASVESAIMLKRRRSILSEKQKLIAEVMEEAKQIIYELPDSVYFEKISKLVEKNSNNGNATIVFNKKDLARLPENFENKLNEILSKKGYKLTISKETREIDGGFVLVYDGIEENCSVSSLFETNIETLQDEIQKLLF